MAGSLELISRTTLASSAASITFSSIPATWTDLRVVVYWKLTGGDYYPSFRLNGNSSAIYSYTSLRGNGNSAGSGKDTNKTEARLSTDYARSSTQPVLVTIDLFGYAGGTYKTALCSVSQDLNGSGIVTRDAVLCQSTSAVTSITLLADSVFGGNLNAGTTATLYGIKG